MDQFLVSNRRKAIKNTSSDLIGKFILLKKRILFEGFLEHFFKFNCFLSHLETSHLSYWGSVNDKRHLQLNEARWTNKIVCKESLMFS